MNLNKFQQDILTASSTAWAIGLDPPHRSTNTGNTKLHKQIKYNYSDKSKYLVLNHFTFDFFILFTFRCFYPIVIKQMSVLICWSLQMDAFIQRHHQCIEGSLYICIGVCVFWEFESIASTLLYQEHVRIITKVIFIFQIQMSLLSHVLILT